ncbi:MAG: YkgJ family cysteine cluster protein [Methanothrix sp.]|nr:MAG: YkgJ family cysteine cluster protein [Methanothrix sp.]
MEAAMIESDNGKFNNNSKSDKDKLDKGKSDKSEGKQELIVEESKSFLEWFRDEVPEIQSSLAAAQVLFECKNCGECCKGEGYALVTNEDLQRIADFSGKSASTIFSQFTDPDPEKREGCRILKNMGPERICCFYDARARRCKIHEGRPEICRTFPMLSIDVEQEEPISLYSDCRGTADLLKVLKAKAKGTEIQNEMKELQEDADRLATLRLMLFMRQLQIAGREDEAEHVRMLAGIRLPVDEVQFKKDCLAYVLLTLGEGP